MSVMNCCGAEYADKQVLSRRVCHVCVPSLDASPCVMFFDEFQALFTSRDGGVRMACGVGAVNALTFLSRCVGVLRRNTCRAYAASRRSCYFNWTRWQRSSRH